MKSDVRKLLFTMIGKFKKNEVERRIIFKQTQEHLREFPISLVMKS